SVARPGGNATGFLTFEYSLSTKWPELLKQVASNVMRAAVLRDPVTPSGTGQFGVIQTVASSIGLEVFPINARDGGGIERALATLGASRHGGVITTSGGIVEARRDLIVALAAPHKLPSVYHPPPLLA